MSGDSRRKSWIAVIGIALVLGAVTWGLVRWWPPSTGAEVGERAPDARLIDLATGDSVGIRTAFAGEVTLVNVWATWCVPCRIEMPSIERLYQTYRDRGFRVAAASIDDSASAPVLDYAHAHGLTFSILQDRTGRIMNTLDMVVVPESFLLDRRGRIAYVALGARQWDSPENRRRVELLLANAD